MREPLTLITEQYRKKRRNHRIIFGDPVRCVRLDWHRKLQAFEPGQVFGYERWDGNRYGTQTWSIVIGCASQPGHSATRVPGIKPGADIWLRARGKIQCKRVWDVLNALKQAGIAPETVPVRHWRAAHSDLVAGADIRLNLERLLC